MAERAMPEYREAQGLAVRDAEGIDPKSLGDFIRGRSAAIDLVADWEPWLFPKDDDG